MGFGTPSQVITGIFDTGSSDLIIPRAGTIIPPYIPLTVVCRLETQQCQGSKLALGDYESAKYGDVKRVPNSGFAAGFQSGDTCDGPYISTSVSVGDAKIKAAQVGLAVNGTVSQDSAQFPVLGVGPIDAEQTVDNAKYANLPQRMKDVGSINTNMFSVWLNPTPFANGPVVFGGIDGTKYAGRLQTVPIEPDNSGRISGFVVRLSSVQLSMSGPRGGQRNGRPQNRQSTVMDLGLGRSEGFTSVNTGTPFIVIPSGSMENLARALDTTFSEKDGLGLVNCQLASGNSSLIFGFNQGQTMLSVTLARTVISKEISKTSQTGSCALAIAQLMINVMGYPFMSAVNTVFDRDSERMMFAQAV
ncbi:hypothetical protein J3458_001476 [Metarhizium acridum]|uniref:uncharacterized protein n=1 Tax=Metarhizium acridum TaxID=92637 RepID=UPI001C6C7BBF|nr:hypothetical protein J3458_001476 [Metarhizium acridum]